MWCWRPGSSQDRETAASIFAYSRDTLAPYKRIRRLEFAELPKTISGKIRRVELRGREDEVTRRPAPTGRPPSSARRTSAEPVIRPVEPRPSAPFNNSGSTIPGRQSGQEFPAVTGTRSTTLRAKAISQATWRIRSSTTIEPWPASKRYSA